MWTSHPRRTRYLDSPAQQAGSNWRFQHSEDNWPRSIFSVYLLAVLFWAGCLVAVVWLGFWPSLVALPAKLADVASVIEIRDVTMEKATFGGDIAEWRIRATVLSHSPSLSKGSALVYLTLDVAMDLQRRRWALPISAIRLFG